MTTVPSTSHNEDDLSFFIPEAALSVINSIDSLINEDCDEDNSEGRQDSDQRRVQTHQRNYEHPEPVKSPRDCEMDKQDIVFDK